MGFRFPLATVLRVRAIQEEREERVLAQIVAEIAQTIRLHAEVEAAIAQAGASRRTQVASLSSGAALHRHYGELASLRQTQADLQVHREKLEVLREKQLTIYTRAHQSREMLSSLDEAQRAEHSLEITKREQKMLDDVFGARQRRP